MRFFFRSRQFRIIVAVFGSVLIITLAFAFGGNRLAPYTDVAGIVTAPFKSAYAAVSNGIKDFVAAYKSGSELMLENTKLNDEVNELRKRTSDYDKIKQENDFYKKYLGIKESNPDFNFVSATVISKDTSDTFGGFVINKGSASKIGINDIVITDGGLVGKITEIGTTTAKVTTVLSPEITLGALDSRTSDSGILGGNIQVSGKKMCRFSNLSRSCSIAIGDYVVTSGEGIFPDGLLVGSVSNIGTDKHNSSIYADIKPFVDFKSLRNVMVITDFEGKGGINPKKVK